MPSTAHGWWTQYLDFVERQQRRAGHHQLALACPATRSPTSPPPTPPSTRAASRTRGRTRSTSTARPTSRTRPTAPGTSPGWSGPAPTACGRTGPAAATCTTTSATCSSATRPASTSPRASGGSTASTPRRPARSSSVTPSRRTTRSPPRRPASAKILVGGGRTTGNIAVNLQRLDTTSGIVQNNQVRVLVQRIPYNGGGAVAGPVTVANSVVTLSNNAATVNLPHTNPTTPSPSRCCRRRTAASSRSPSPSTPSSA